VRPQSWSGLGYPMRKRADDMFCFTFRYARYVLTAVPTVTFKLAANSAKRPFTSD
jgi:hypothetical protein